MRAHWRFANGDSPPCPRTVAISCAPCMLACWSLLSVAHRALPDLLWRHCALACLPLHACACLSQSSPESHTLRRSTAIQLPLHASLGCQAPRPPISSTSPEHHMALDPNRQLSPSSGSLARGAPGTRERSGGNSGDCRGGGGGGGEREAVEAAAAPRWRHGGQSQILVHR